MMDLTPLALTMVVVIGFAFLGALASRNGRQLVSAVLAAGIWLFLASSVLVWFWRRANLLLEPTTRQKKAG
jgi:uncharacterized protein (DUF697 family)